MLCPDPQTIWTSSFGCKRHFEVMWRADGRCSYFRHARISVVDANSAAALMSEMVDHHQTSPALDQHKERPQQPRLEAALASESELALASVLALVSVLESALVSVLVLVLALALVSVLASAQNPTL